MGVWLSIKVRVDQGNLVRKRGKQVGNEDLLNIDHRAHDNWVVFFQDVKPPKSCSPEEHGTCRVQSNV